jgi:hypothetical protein
LSDKKSSDRPDLRNRPKGAQAASVGRSGSIESDAPTEQDQLGRSQYVEAPVDIITNAETPFVIAIYGSWGTGKTSLMLQLRRNLDPGFDAQVVETEPGSARTVWFDPWMHQFDDTPALGLLHATAQQLGIATERNVATALAQLALAMSEDVQIPFIGVRLGKLFRIREEIAQNDYNRREAQARLRTHLQTVLEATGAPKRRVVFFIDDLDRCQPATAVRLLEALKLYLDFAGCVFVLAVDREPLEAAVAAEYRALGLRTESYLDKIIQLPFAIPSIRQDQMDEFVQSRLSDDLETCADVLAAAASDEPRSVKRVANALLLNHRLARSAEFSSGYSPRILALVVLIQNHAPDLYRELRLDPSIIHEVYRSKDAEGPGDDSSSQADLWTMYIATKPRLDRALRLVHLPDDLDLSPYVTLTSTVLAEKPSSSARILGEPVDLKVFLSYRLSSRPMVSRLTAGLTELGWKMAFDEINLAQGDDIPMSLARTVAGSLATIALIDEGWLQSDWTRAEVEIALDSGVPVIPVLYGQPPPSSTRLPPRLARIQAIVIDESNFERRLAELDRALNAIIRASGRYS